MYILFQNHYNKYAILDTIRITCTKYCTTLSETLKTKELLPVINTVGGNTYAILQGTYPKELILLCSKEPITWELIKTKYPELLI